MRIFYSSVLVSLASGSRSSTPSDSFLFLWRYCVQIWHADLRSSSPNNPGWPGAVLVHWWVRAWPQVFIEVLCPQGASRWQGLTRGFIRGFGAVLGRRCWDLTFALLKCGAFCIFKDRISRLRSAHCRTGGRGWAWCPKHHSFHLLWRNGSSHLAFCHHSYILCFVAIEFFASLFLSGQPLRLLWVEAERCSLRGRKSRLRLVCAPGLPLVPPRTLWHFNKSEQLLHSSCLFFFFF